MSIRAFFSDCVDPEDKGRKRLRNVGNYLRIDSSKRTSVFITLSVVYIILCTVAILFV
jgi:hypothetical protein